MKNTTERKRGYAGVVVQTSRSVVKKKKDGIVLRSGVEYRNDLMGKETVKRLFCDNNKTRA